LAERIARAFQVAGNALQTFIAFFFFGFEPSRKSLCLFAEKTFNRLETAAHRVLQFGGFTRKGVFQAREPSLIILDLRAKQDVADLIDIASALVRAAATVSRDNSDFLRIIHR